jgi:hypothetical protein
MTYLFLVIAIGLIMAIGKGSWDDLGILSLIIITITALLESNVLMKKEQTKIIIYDNIKLITPDRRTELLEDLKTRTGFNVHRVDIQSIDFLKDATTLTVFYYN